MKLTKKKILYNVLQLVFYGLVPLTLIFLLYGNLGKTNEAVGFKIAAPGIILLILVFLVFKKLFINKKLADAHSRWNKDVADFEVETNAERRENQRRQIQHYGTIEVLLNAVVPVLLFMLLILCCKVMEAQLVKLSGTCGFILLSYICGTVFAVLDAREVTCKIKKKKEKKV